MSELVTVRRKIRIQAISVGLAVAPFGAAFGALCTEAGLGTWEALGFSSFVFGGSSQFAAVTVLAEGGTIVAAVIAGLLLNLRSLAFGVAMAPSLRGSLLWRALTSQLMIDEATAVGSSQQSHALRRYGYLWAGFSVFIFWNFMTWVGVALLSGAGTLIEDLGIDATIPAAFLGLVWPKLSSREHQIVAGIGAVVAFLLVPVVPPGIPVIAAASAVLFLRPWKEQVNHE
tara:strand:+ start:2726 stop:3412 length:687 start_codon:yes stop_codon:yes gene_type:complete